MTSEGARCSPLPASVETAARIDPATAAGLLRDWGFLVRRNLPERNGPAYLLVALRERPTLRHFDPEVVRFWETRGGRGCRVALDRRLALPFSRPFAWGRIEIEDRLGVTNEYLTFGGRLLGARVDDASVLVFESPVPILRRGGHSQAWDRGADQLAAFFARLKVAVDYVPGFEQELGSASPETCYVAFVVDAVDRYRRSEALRSSEPELWRTIRSACSRLRTTCPETMGAASALLQHAAAIPV
ncbi:MAG TPA: hypothetical protein VFK54_05320 [Candidatus Limnocylindrales bacterium]|nr:hypothetical protein [Candidatus Limnocylindrales bacterium]